MNRIVFALFMWLIALPAFAISPPMLAVVQPAVTNTVSNTGWAPTNLGVSVKNHWAASDLVATPISTWTDNVGSVAVMAASTAQPAWSATGFNGLDGTVLPAVTCNGVANALATTTLTGVATGSIAGEMWALADQQTPSGSIVILMKYGGTAADTSRQLQLNGTAANFPFVVQTGNATTAITDRTTPFQGPSVVQGSWAGTVQGGRIDGRVAQTSPTTIATLATGTTRLRICANNGTSAANFMAVAIADLYLTSSLTVSQRLQMEGYLSWHGGLTAKLPFNHPFRFRKP